MNCWKCHHGVYKAQKVNVKLERNGSIVIVKNVPAKVCDECGDTTYSSKTVERMHKLANNALQNGFEISVVQMKAAA